MARSPAPRPLATWRDAGTPLPPPVHADAFDGGDDMISVMIALKAHFDGKVLVPEEPLALAPNQIVRITVEPVAASPAARIELGKQPGAITDFAPDWEEPLPDEIWGFEG